MKTPNEFINPTLSLQIGLATNEVVDEVLRAKKLHGDKPFNSVHEGYAVLLEEVDELWDEVKKNPRKMEGGKKQHRELMRKEAVQVAAMAIRFVSELTVEPVATQYTPTIGVAHTNIGQ